MPRLLLASILLFLLPALSFARGVSAKEAAMAADAWLRRHPAPLRTAPGAVPAGAAVRTLTRADGAALCHIVPLSGGGWVATSADTALLPVVAFSADGEADADPAPGSPLHALLAADMAAALDVVSAGGAKRAALASDGEDSWASLLGEDGEAKGGVSAAGLSTISDVRVAKLVGSKWNQERVGGKTCYNYYTPSNYVCGCVATAMAQIMRYHEFPTASVAAKAFPCYVNDFAASFTMIGGVYDWASMPLAPTSAITEPQRQAIGKICYDAGVSARMDWTPDGSGALGGFVYDAFRNVFGYASAQSYMLTSGDTLNVDVLRRLIGSNCDARCPTLLGISGDQGGHAVVADGYGYSGGTFYTHLNMGWSGQYDVWYALPDIDAGYYAFSAVESIVYNIFPEATGDLLTGRVTDLSGNPLPGIALTATSSGTTAMATTDANGIYAFRLSGGRSYTVTATCGVSRESRTVSLTASSSPRTSSLNYATGSYSTSGMSAGNSWGNDIAIEPRYPPEAPAAFAASQGTDLAAVALTWEPVSGATAYAVYRSADASLDNAVCVASNLVGTAYIDAPVRPGVVLCYWISASNANGEGARSAAATGYRGLSTPFFTEAVRDGGAVSLAWSPVAGATHYRVHRADVSTGEKTAVSGWQTATSLSVAQMADAARCYFVEAACDATGARPSAPSAAARP